MKKSPKSQIENLEKKCSELENKLGAHVMKILEVLSVLENNIEECMDRIIALEKKNA